MKKRFAVLVVLVALAGCGQPAEQSLPTLIPTPVQAIDTETPIPVEPSATPVLVDRPTLPPTWTPAVQIVETAVPGEPTTDVNVQSQPQGLPTLVACGGFTVDRERSVTTFTRDTPPTVFWTAVPTAARYRIGLLNDKGEEIFSDYSLENSYTFRLDLFERNQRYAWEVYPEDVLNQQMCLIKVGLELFPQ
ncbi:MAG: hypothetical protein K8L97_02910 [Anaerolineae bacterium]|nr:hypothetical protein [Anaerolineae bacterium]